ncbi:MAG: hypothetical protein J6X33_03380 [Clostridiales bacterium]|nr:hypothetical protein [Clostridiales bacterium]
MSFQRAQWHSGLTYQQTCKNCGTKIRYTDESLDFRPWYADGFVVCPKCKANIRHSEAFAINPDGTPYNNGTQPTIIAQNTPAPAPAPAGPVPGMMYCSNCGKQYNPATDHFCSGCGNKLG